MNVVGGDEDYMDAANEGGWYNHLISITVVGSSIQKINLSSFLAFRQHYPLLSSIHRSIGFSLLTWGREYVCKQERLGVSQQDDTSGIVAR